VPPPSPCLRALLYLTRLALAPASPPQALPHQNLPPQPSTSPHHLADHPPVGRKSFEPRRTEPGFRRPPREAGGLRKPGAEGEPRGKHATTPSTAGRTSTRSPITGATSSPAQPALVHTRVWVNTNIFRFPFPIRLSSSPHGSDRPPVFQRLASKFTHSPKHSPCATLCEHRPSSPTYHPF
jgi:hypothetical protein